MDQVRIPEFLSDDQARTTVGRRYVGLDGRTLACYFLVLYGLFAWFAPCHSRGESDTDLEMVERINSLVAKAWTDASVTPAAPASEGQWVRRLFLDVLGRIPTARELDQHLKNRSPSRRRQLADELLYGEAYQDERVEYWTALWTIRLIGRSDGDEGMERLTHREGMRRYLRAAISEARPYDVMVRELITATGTTRPGSEGFNGATNFLVGKLDDRAVQATSKIAQIFLGTRVQCMQCHDHPFHSGKQEQFWSLNSFLRQTVALRSFDGRMIRNVTLTDQDFAGEGGNPEEAEVYFEQRNALLRVAYPAFLDGTPLENRSGYLEDVHRRTALAEFAVASPLLEKALINWMWKHFLGYGFTEPVDDLGPHRPVSHPELADTLAEQFRASRFDLRKLIRSIVLSKPYGLSSQAQGRKELDEPAHGAPPLFSRFYARQMSPEQVYDSMITLTAPRTIGSMREEMAGERSEWVNAFVSEAGNDEALESALFDGSILQTLSMFNGRLTQEVLALKKDHVITMAARPPRLTLGQRLDLLALSAVSRRARPAERRLVQQMIAAHERWPASKSTESKEEERLGSMPLALQDYWWALLNSNEFLLIH